MTNAQWSPEGGGKLIEPKPKRKKATPKSSTADKSASKAKESK